MCRFHQKNGTQGACFMVLKFRWRSLRSDTVRTVSESDAAKSSQRHRKSGERSDTVRAVSKATLPDAVSDKLKGLTPTPADR